MVPLVFGWVVAAFSPWLRLSVGPCKSLISASSSIKNKALCAPLRAAVRAQAQQAATEQALKRLEHLVN